MFHHCFKRVLWQFGPRRGWRSKHSVTELLKQRLQTRILLFLHEHTSGKCHGPLAGRRQQISDTVLGSPATPRAKLPEYVHEAVVEDFEMH
jgi:hypothetical protein